MTHPLLERLLSDDLDLSMPMTDNANAIRAVLARGMYVLDLRIAIDGGTISTDEIHQFVSRIVGGIVKGVRLENESALVAIAVALDGPETWHRWPAGVRMFAAEYLDGLAGLRLAEMSMASRVARACIDARSCGKKDGDAQGT